MKKKYLTSMTINSLSEIIHLIIIQDDVVRNSSISSISTQFRPSPRKSAVKPFGYNPSKMD